MKKGLMVTLCFAVLTTSALFLISGKTKQQVQTLSASSNKSMSSYCTANTVSSQESSSSAASSQTAVCFIVKEYNGHIGVYRSSESKPFREYNTDVQILPKADRIALEHGKTVHTMAEVEKIVEDYDG